MGDLVKALSCELKGNKPKALRIYKDILKDDPYNDDIKKAIKRVQKATRVNEEMRDFFISIDNEDKKNEFERWLVKLWN